MADSLTFTFSLDDKTSGPLKRMTDAMEKLADGEKHVSEEASTTHSWLERFAEIEVFKTAYEWAEKLTDKVAEFGKEILHTADYSRTQKIALEGLTGSAEAASRVFEGAKAFAIEAGTPLKATVDAYRELTLAGVQVQNLPKILQAASDLSIFKHGTTDQMGEFANILGRIQSKGSATSMEFRTLKGLLDFKALAKNLGVSDVMDATKDSAIGAERAIGAILTTMAQMEHGTLGEVTKKVGEGWAGAVHKISTRWDEMLEHFGETKGFQAVLGFMDRLQLAMAPGGKLDLAISHVADKVGHWLETLDKPGAFDDFLNRTEKIAGALERILSVGAKVAVLFDNAVLKGDPAKSAGEENPVMKAYEDQPWYYRITHKIPALATRDSSLPTVGASPGEGANAATQGRIASAGTPAAVHITNHNYPSPGMDTYDFAQQVSNITTSDMTPYFDGVHLAAGSGNG